MFFLKFEGNDMKPNSSSRVSWVPASINSG